MVKSKRFVEVKDEDSVVHEKKTADKKSTDGKKNEVRGESNQENVCCCNKVKCKLKWKAGEKRNCIERNSWMSLGFVLS